MVGQGLSLSGEVGDHRELRVGERAEDQAGGHREVGHVCAGLRERGVDGVGVEGLSGGGERLDGVGVEGDALLGGQVVHEHGVEFEVAVEVEGVVALGCAGRAQGAGSQQDRGSRGAGGGAAVGQPDRPGRHADGEEPGEDAAFLGEFARLGGDRPGATAGLVEGGGLAHEVGELGRLAREQHRHAAGMGGREVEGARRKVAVPEQRVAPAEVDEVARPGGAGGVHAVVSRSTGLTTSVVEGWSVTCAG